MSENEKVEAPANSSVPKKGLKDIWNELTSKTQLWFKIAAAAVAVIVVFAIGFTSGYEKAKDDVRTALEQAFAGVDSASTPAATQEPVKKDAKAELGTRNNPAPMGTTVIFSDKSGDLWEVTLSDPVLNANDVIANENMFNDAAPEGLQYAMVMVTAKYVGKETGTPAWDLNISFVSAAGTTHTSGDFSVVPPTSLNDVNELYPDAAGSGNVVIAVPTADIESGNWVVTAGYGNDKYFYKAQ